MPLRTISKLLVHTCYGDCTSPVKYTSMMRDALAWTLRDRISRTPARAAHTFVPVDTVRRAHHLAAMDDERVRIKNTGSVQRRRRMQALTGQRSTAYGRTPTALQAVLAAGHHMCAGSTHGVQFAELVRHTKLAHQLPAHRTAAG